MDTEGAAIPVDFIPTNVTRAGPILIDNAPVSEQDPELAQWLKQAPTILFSPGSYFRVGHITSPFVYLPPSIVLLLFGTLTSDFGDY